MLIFAQASPPDKETNKYLNALDTLAYKRIGRGALKPALLLLKFSAIEKNLPHEEGFFDCLKFWVFRRFCG